MTYNDNIKVDSAKILNIYSKYTAIHKEADKLKDQIKILEERLGEFSVLAEEVRKEESEFYELIANKYNVSVDTVISFVSNAVLKLKNNE